MSLSKVLKTSHCLYKSPDCTASATGSVKQRNEKFIAFVSSEVFDKVGKRKKIVVYLKWMIYTVIRLSKTIELFSNKKILSFSLLSERDNESIISHTVDEAQASGPIAQAYWE